MDIKEITGLAEIQRGINNTSSGEHDGRMVFMKRHSYCSNGPEDATAEIAGALFARQLGLESATFLLAKEDAGYWTTVQTAMDGKHVSRTQHGDEFVDTDDVWLSDTDAAGFYLLDNLLHNPDRHEYNFLHNPATGRTIPIDHGLARCGSGSYWTVRRHGSVWNLPNNFVPDGPALAALLATVDIDAVQAATMELMAGKAHRSYFGRVREWRQEMHEQLGGML